MIFSLSHRVRHFAYQSQDSGCGATCLDEVATELDLW